MNKRTYFFKHPNTGKIYEDERTVFDVSRPFVAPDGVECESTHERPKDHEIHKPLKKSKTTEKKLNKEKPKGINNKTREVWEVDRKYVRDCKPKFVRTRSGERIKYDPKSMG